MTATDLARRSSFTVCFELWGVRHPWGTPPRRRQLRDFRRYGGCGRHAGRVRFRGLGCGDGFRRLDRFHERIAQAGEHVVIVQRSGRSPCAESTGSPGAIACISVCAFTGLLMQRVDKHATSKPISHMAQTMATRQRCFGSLNAVSTSTRSSPSDPKLFIRAWCWSRTAAQRRP